AAPWSVPAGRARLRSSRRRPRAPRRARGSGRRQGSSGEDTARAGTPARERPAARPAANLDTAVPVPLSRSHPETGIKPQIVRLAHHPTPHTDEAYMAALESVAPSPDAGAANRSQPARTMIRVEKLLKVYGGNVKKPAVDGISFEVHAGEVLGFVGPNG